MVCYARPVSMMAGIILVVFLVFGKPTVHFFDTAALVVAVSVALAVAAIAAALVAAAAMSTRRRRAASGGCVSCRYRCQHAMTEQPGRMWPVSTAEPVHAMSTPARGRAASTAERVRAMSTPARGRAASTAERVRAMSTAARGRAASVPGRASAVGVPAGRTLLPIQPVVPRHVPDNGLELVPRWPDRPIYRVGQRAT
jgi:hypothetical protein